MPGIPAVGIRIGTELVSAFEIDRDIEPDSDTDARGLRQDHPEDQLGGYATTGGGLVCDEPQPLRPYTMIRSRNQDAVFSIIRVAERREPLHNPVNLIPVTDDTAAGFFRP